MGKEKERFNLTGGASDTISHHNKSGGVRAVGIKRSSAEDVLAKLKEHTKGDPSFPQDSIVKDLKNDPSFDYNIQKARNLMAGYDTTANADSSKTSASTSSGNNNIYLGAVPDAPKKEAVVKSDSGVTIKESAIDEVRDAVSKDKVNPIFIKDEKTNPVYSKDDGIKLPIKESDEKVTLVQDKPVVNKKEQNGKATVSTPLVSEPASDGSRESSSSSHPLDILKEKILSSHKAWKMRDTSNEAN